MFRYPVLLLALTLICPETGAADPPPVVGLCIAAPRTGEVDRFLRFMEEDLAPAGINTLVLRVDYNFDYASHPELRQEDPLTLAQVKAMAETGRRLGIQIIPQINLLGHQSWHGNPGKLLEVYPEFDETPSVPLPESYQWPNPHGLYCKSYCPLHPDVHPVVFALVDELMDAFEARAFHAGMDEVFYIGMDECPRCRGKDPSGLFAGEVNRIRDHLAASGRELWIWGDRLIDGRATGIGLWEASENDTHRAVNLIRKDVVICDWHYEEAHPTAALFALKGFRVITCPWNRPGVTTRQLELTDTFRSNAPEPVKDRYLGVMQTVWSPASRFLDHWEASGAGENSAGDVESLQRIIHHYGRKDEE